MSRKNSDNTAAIAVGIVVLVALALAVAPWLFMLTVGALYHHDIVSQSISFVESFLILVATRILLTGVNANAKVNG